MTAARLAAAAAAATVAETEPRTGRWTLCSRTALAVLVAGCPVNWGGYHPRSHMVLAAAAMLTVMRAALGPAAAAGAAWQADARGASQVAEAIHPDRCMVRPVRPIHLARPVHLARPAASVFLHTHTELPRSLLALAQA